MDGNDNQIPESPFTGTSLAAQMVMVPGDTLKIRLVTDYSVTDWGFRVTEVVSD